MKPIKQNEANKWFPEIEWLSNNLEKFNVDYLKVIVHAKEKEMPEPKTNIANILRSAAAAGIIEPMETYRKSDWKGSSRVPRQFWRKAKSKTKGK
jgi:hypothetical protein